MQFQSDFTDMGKPGVTIRGERYPRLVYRCALSYPNWEHVEIAGSGTFEALAGDLQESPCTLGGVPRESLYEVERLARGIAVVTLHLCLCVCQVGDSKPFREIGQT